MEKFFIFSTVVLWIAVIFLGVALFALARQIGLLHERIAPAGALLVNQKVRVGDAAPELTVATLDGREIKIGGSSQKSLLLFFLSPSCPMCKALLPVVKSSQTAEKSWLDVIYASDGVNDAHKDFALAHELPADQYVISEALGRALGVSKLPYAVLLNPEGRIVSMGLVNSREHIESLFNAGESGIVSIQEYMSRDATQKKTAIGA